MVKSYVQVKGFIGNKSALIVKAINLNICIYIFELTINQKAVQSQKRISFMLNVQSWNQISFMFYFLSSKRIYIYSLFFTCHLKMNFLLTDLMDDLTTGSSHIYTFSGIFGNVRPDWNLEYWAFLLPCRLRIACASESAGHALPSSSSSLPSPIFSAHLNLFTRTPQIPRTHSFQVSSCLF